MNFHPYAIATTVEGNSQVIPQGPVAALEIIKNLGTNGGGFFNANGAHPYENPTPLSNFLEMLAIVLLPAALTNTFGRMVGRPRQGWLFYGVMVLLFGVGLIFTHHFEQRGNPLLRGVDSHNRSAQPGGNMEGKEVRFGVGGPVLTAEGDAVHAAFRRDHADLFADGVTVRFPSSGDRLEARIAARCIMKPKAGGPGRRRSWPTGRLSP